MGRWGLRAGLLVAVALALFPVYWVVLTAFRPRGEIFSSPAKLLPGSLTLDNVRTVWFGS
jgi:ABC-type glycerol-3-phosphate transport system permease component